MGTIDIGADGRKFILKGVADKTLRGQMITFIWPHPVDHLEEAGITVQRGGVEHQPVMIEEMAEAPEPVFRILKGHASDNTVHCIVLAQQQLRKVGAVLPCDPGDQRFFHALYTFQERAVCTLKKVKFSRVLRWHTVNS